jgi:hypothetical protein
MMEMERQRCGRLPIKRDDELPRHSNASVKECMV